LTSGADQRIEGHQYSAAKTTSVQAGTKTKKKQKIAETKGRMKC
jgi:hypothetical protein